MLGSLAIMGGGALLGGLGQWMSDKDAAKRYAEAMAQYESRMANALAGYQSAAQGNINAYQNQAMQYLNTPEGVNAWLNPSMDWQMSQAAKANNAQYGAAGKLNSGAAMKSLQDRSQNMAKMSWQDAYSNMTAANNQGLGFAGGLAGMRNDMDSNVFNARQGMHANMLSGAMGQPSGGLGSILSGAASGLGAGASLVNALRSSPTAAPGVVQKGGS